MKLTESEIFDKWYCFWCEEYKSLTRQWCDECSKNLKKWKQ